MIDKLLARDEGGVSASTESHELHLLRRIRREVAFCPRVCLDGVSFGSGLLFFSFALCKFLRSCACFAANAATGNTFNSSLHSFFLPSIHSSFEFQNRFQTNMENRADGGTDTVPDSRSWTSKVRDRSRDWGASILGWSWWGSKGVFLLGGRRIDVVCPLVYSRSSMTAVSVVHRSLDLLWEWTRLNLSSTGHREATRAVDFCSTNTCCDWNETKSPSPISPHWSSTSVDLSITTTTTIAIIIESNRYHYQYQ